MVAIQLLKRCFSSAGMRKRGFTHAWEDAASPIDEVVYKKSRAPARNTKLFGWGLAASGCLGWGELVQPRFDHPTSPVINYPFRISIEDESRVRGVACGYGFTIFQDKHRVRGCGLNTNSQLGFLPDNRSASENAVKEVLKPRVVKSKQWVIKPFEVNLPLLYPDSTRITAVAAGRAHTVVATDQEGLFTLGNNAHGQCGRPVLPAEDYSHSHVVHQIRNLGNEGGGERIIQLVAGMDHCSVLTETGRVYAWGNGTDGQLGRGNFESSHVPELVKGPLEGIKITNITCSADTILAVSDSGEVYGWGNTEYGQLVGVQGAAQSCEPVKLALGIDGEKIIKVAAAGSMCAALTNAGSVHVWGHGLLGLGPKVATLARPKILPRPLFGENELSGEVNVLDIQAGLHYFAAITDRRELFTWGSNRYGILGQKHKRRNQPFPLKVNLAGDVFHVACGPDHVFAMCRAMI